MSTQYVGDNGGPMDRLHAEAARLRATLDGVRAEIQEYEQQAGEQRVEAKRLRAELEKERKCRHCVSPNCGGCECVNELVGDLRTEVADLRRRNNRHLCGCEESAGVFGCGLDCPCACHPLRSETDALKAELEWFNKRCGWYQLALDTARSETRREVLEECAKEAEAEGANPPDDSWANACNSVAERIRALATPAPKTRIVKTVTRGEPLKFDPDTETVDDH